MGTTCSRLRCFSCSQRSTLALFSVPPAWGFLAPILVLRFAAYPQHFGGTVSGLDELAPAAVTVGAGLDTHRPECRECQRGPGVANVHGAQARPASAEFIGRFAGKGVGKRRVRG
jgi:hypothetical protein